MALENGHESGIWLDTGLNLARYRFELLTGSSKHGIIAQLVVRLLVVLRVLGSNLGVGMVYFLFINTFHLYACTLDVFGVCRVLACVWCSCGCCSCLCSCVTVGGVSGARASTKGTS